MEHSNCSLIDIAPTISKLLNIPMMQPDGRALSQVVDYAHENGCRSALIIIVDSLGYSLFRHLSGSMHNLTELSQKGMIFKCISPAGHTTPAISSIFTGYVPQNHHIYVTDDIYREREKDGANPRIKTIMEWAHGSGLRSGIVIESAGAEAMVGRVDLACGVPDSDDIIDYDEQITTSALKALEKDPDVFSIHLRSIDRFAHRAQEWKDVKSAAEAVDRNLGKIISNAQKGTLFIICGDHPIHSPDKWLNLGSEQDIGNHEKGYVTLIVGSN
jgi:hypothetical protein